MAVHKRPYAHDHAPVGDFLAAIRALKPTAIIGVAAHGQQIGGRLPNANVAAMLR